MLLPETCKESSKVVIERIRSAVESHPFLGREEMPMKKVTISAGISAFPEDGADAQSLIRAADKALYDAKSHGRNVVCVA
jgi:diguanylate cyclase (GGDEF)-like protein